MNPDNPLLRTGNGRLYSGRVSSLFHPQLKRKAADSRRKSAMDLVHSSLRELAEHLLKPAPRISVSMLRGLPVPLHRLACVLINAKAFLVHVAKAGLGTGVPLLRSLSVIGDRDLVIFGNAIAAGVCIAHAVLRLSLPLLSGLAPPLYRLICILLASETAVIGPSKEVLRLGVPLVRGLNKSLAASS